MKYLFIAYRFHTNMYYRVKSLQDAGHTVKVLAFYKGVAEYHNNIDIEILPESIFTKIISALSSPFKVNYLKTSFELKIMMPAKFRHAISEFKPDCILLKNFQSIFAVYSLIISKIRKIKLILLIQTDKNHIWGSKSLFKLNLWFYKKLGLKTIITPMKIAVEKLIEVGWNNIHYQPFVYPVQNNQIMMNDIEPFQILSIGKFVKRKDQMLLLKVFKKLTEKYNIRLTLIGEIADKQYFMDTTDYILDNNLGKLVTIIENIDYDMINAEYQNHHLFVLPSYQEPAAYSIVEAMANGLPVICSTECGTNCYIENGINGYIFKAGNVDDLCEKTEMILKDKIKLLEMSENAHKIALKNHDPKEFNEKINKIINNA